MIKHTLISLIYITTNIGIFAQSITFHKTEVDLGVIHEINGDVFYDFIFSNVGTKPLYIKKVITGCGCTAAEWSTNPYQPNINGKIRIIYHPSNRMDENINIPIEVSTNVGTFILTLTGKVKTDKVKVFNYFDLNKGKKSEYVSYNICDDYEEILNRIREQLFQTNSVENAVNKTNYYTKQLDKDGRWLQLDYKCVYGPTWEPIIHLSRIKQMSIAYANKDSELYGNNVLYDAIVKSLQMWCKHRPTSSNWWYNDISVPQTIADILVMMDNAASKLDLDLKRKLILLMDRSSPKKYIGANKMDIAVHHLIRGCLLKNDSIVTANVHELYHPICISEKEGIREDLSFQQHNNQLYIGGYGTEFVKNVLRIAPLFIGTKFQMNEEQSLLFSKFIRKTYLNTFRSHYMDYSVCGRSISRKNALFLGEWEYFFKKMKQIDSTHLQEYENLSQRFITNNPFIGRYPTNLYFYNSDYIIHSRKGYDFSVRAVSKRTCRSESGNGENLLGTYLSEGAINLRINGDEYYNIFPVWEWDKIPGTTTPEGEVINKNEWGVYGVVDYVGGVSDGKYGVMAYALDDYGVRAKKGWFMFDNEIVCLGAGITSQSNRNINTSINQCHLQGNVYAIQGNKIEKIEKEQHLICFYKGWIWHNQIGYYFPENVKMNLKNKIQSGNWAKINYNQSTESISLPIFNLWINHGQAPQNNNYAYIIVPNIADANSISNYDVNDIIIKSNTKDLQAVINKKLDILQAIFYSPGEISYEKKVYTVNKPCVIIIKNVSTSNPEILIKDPTQQENFHVGSEINYKSQ